jgi:tetratricopeptide (TPR) repeat protein
MNTPKSSRKIDADDARDFKRVAGIMLAIIVITGVVFGPVSHFGFINYDDDEYVYANPVVTQGLTFHGIAWAFTGAHAANWHPLTWISHMIDWEIYGPNAGGHHMTNFILHEFSTIILFLVLARATRATWPSAFVAVLFAIHPLRVESVVWVAERKDVLSGFMWMLTLGAYINFTRNPSWKNRLYVAMFFILGLFSKSMLVTLPFVLLLLDYWPLGRVDLSDLRDAARSFSRLVIEKIPLFIIAAITCVIAVAAQRQGGSLASIERFSIAVRVSNALVSYAGYLGKIFLPINLALPYPHYGSSLPPSIITLSAALFLAITIAAILLARRAPYFIVGWFWWVGSLLPVIGLVQIGGQSMADRYTYLPSIGVFIALAWGASGAMNHLLKGFPTKARACCFAIPAMLIIAALSATSMAQVMLWRDSKTLFEHSVKVTSDNTIAQNNLGTALMELERYNEAMKHFAKAVEIAPDNIEAKSNLGVAQLLQGRAAEAESIFTEILRDRPQDFTIETNLGAALLSQGRNEEARKHFDRAVQLDPNCDKALKALEMLGPGK